MPTRAGSGAAVHQVKEKMNWRSFAHQDAINAKWNPSTPGYYVLDPRGVIRHKWVGAPGEKAIDTALEKLINEAEVKKHPFQQELLQRVFHQDGSVGDW